MLIEDVNQAEMSSEAPSGAPSDFEADRPQSDVDSQTGAAESDAGLVEQGGEPAVADARIAELEQAVSEKDSEITALKQSVAELDEQVATASSSLAEAVLSYKGMIIASNPDVMGELISGDTTESIDDSLEKAKSLIGKVRQGLEAEISLARVPAGAPERRPPDLSALSPREKIQSAIGGRR